MPSHECGARHIMRLSRCGLLLEFDACQRPIQVAPGVPYLNVAERCFIDAIFGHSLGPGVSTLAGRYRSSPQCFRRAHGLKEHYAPVRFNCCRSCRNGGHLLSALASLDDAEALLLYYFSPQESNVLSPIYRRRTAMEKSCFDVIAVDDTCGQWCM